MARTRGLWHERWVGQGRACGLVFVFVSVFVFSLALDTALAAPALQAAEQAETGKSAAPALPPRPPPRPATLTAPDSSASISAVETAPDPMLEPIPSPDQLSAIAPAAAPDPASPPAAAPPRVSGATMRIQFNSGEAALPESAKQPLIELASRLANAPELRLEIRSYAEGTDETASQSRRLSLDRALAVRRVLIEGGVRSTRIDVRALGNRTEAGPADHADVRVIDRGG
jgi:outer membrane protein OmpA-like peptidoglycan-associated protein